MKPRIFAGTSVTLAALAGLALSMTTAHAAPVTVNNAGFNDDGTQVATPTGSTLDGTFVGTRTGVGALTPTEGSHQMWLNLANAVEAWFGTHPGQFSVGVSNLSSNGTTTTIEHPQNDEPPSDLSGHYEWSQNLSDWYGSGSGPVGGPTVSFVPNTVGTTTTVTATASEALEQLFVRVAVMQN